jgi:hypothetical protein
MDHLLEAEKELQTAIDLGSNDETNFRLKVAEVHALIIIGLALETLAECVTANGILHVANHKES